MIIYIIIEVTPIEVSPITQSLTYSISLKMPLLGVFCICRPRDDDTVLVLTRARQNACFNRRRRVLF